MNQDMDTLFFFRDHLEALPLYEALERWLLTAFPGTRKRVQKTQISFYGRHLFACVSFARVRKKAELPGIWLTYTLGLPAPVESERAAVQTEPYPNRWTVHIVLRDPAELDEELMDWTRQAYSFSEHKR